MLTIVVTIRRRRRAALLLVLVVTVPLLPIQPAAADNHVCGYTNGNFENCWYLGGGYGFTHVDPEGQAGGWSTNDDSDSGWKFLGGYQFHERWSVELAYVDGGEAGLGNVDPALETLIPNASIDYATPSLMAVRWLNTPRSAWNPFVKLGVSAIDNDTSDSRIPFEKQTSVQLAAGVGAQLKFAERWFVRAEADLYDRDHHYAGIAFGGMFGGAGRSMPAPIVPEPEPEPAPEPVPPPPPPPPPEPVCEEVVSVLDGVNFENDSDQLRPDSRNVLNSIVSMLKNSPEDTVKIDAYSDSNGSEEYNLALSVRRAASVEDYLVSAGIVESRLSSEGFGEAQPIGDNATPEGRAMNRRVQLVWTSERCQ